MPRSPESLDLPHPSDPLETETWATPEPSPLFQSPTQPPPEISYSPHDGPQSSEPHDASPDSPPRSTGKAKLRELRAMCRTAVKTAGGAAHQLLTVDGSPERAEGLYVPDRDDVDAIADPLASLASRRMPEGAENPDITDLVRLAMGLLGYGIKQRVKRAQLAQVLGYGDPEDPDAGAATGEDFETVEL